MVDFKNSLISEPDTRPVKEIREHNWKTLENAYDDYANYTDQMRTTREKKDLNDKKYKTRTRHKKNKHQQTLHLFDHMHEDLIKYWQPYGFLNKSTPTKFVYAILPAIKISRYCANVPLEKQPEQAQQDL